MSQSCLIIGGGVAGACLSRTLAARGVAVTLIEKSELLCSGATWHAAGLVTRFGGSPKLKKIHVRSLQILNELHDESENGISLHTPGSIRIIEKGNPDRLKEAHQHVAMAALYDDPEFPCEIISADECGERHPLLDCSNVECGVWTPNDGDIDPTSLVNAVSGKAKADGAKYILNTEVVSIEHRQGGGFCVKSACGQVFEGDMLVNAAGLWSKQITEMVGDGMVHPGFIIEHQYVKEIPEIAALLAKGKRVYVSNLIFFFYIRQERSGILVGPYEERTVLRNKPDDRGTWKNGPPSDWGHELFPDALDRIEGNLLSAMELCPSLAEVGFINCTNGPTIWTGDSLARVGRTHRYFDFNTLTYGIAQSPALSEYLTSIMLDGEQPFDAAANFDPVRYGSWATAGTVIGDAYTEDVVLDTYGKNNCIAYPFENRKAGRSHLVEIQSPLYPKLLEQGARCTFSLSGVEVPAWFEGISSASSIIENELTFDHHEWAPHAAAESQHVLHSVGIQYASFSKIKVSGPHARDFLMRATTNIIPKKMGPCRLTYALTPKGKVLAEFSVTKTDVLYEDEYYLVGSRDYAEHDTLYVCFIFFNFELFFPYEISYLTNSTKKNIFSQYILHLAGPKSRELLGAISPAVLDIPFMNMKSLEIAGQLVNVFRVSFSGLVGFEIHCPRNSSSVTAVYDALQEHPLATKEKLNLRPFGGYALNALRVEVGFRVKADLDYMHYKEAGIEPFTSMKKSMGFIGKNTKSLEDITKKPAMFQVNTESGYEWSIPSDCPMYVSFFIFTHFFFS
eukprot:GSMAST32.ASY1.ANO1.2091.1 assembled CDS